MLKATVKHFNATIIWYHMHDVETLGVAFSRVNCDIYEMMFEMLMYYVMLFMMMLRRCYDVLQCICYELGL